MACSLDYSYLVAGKGLYEILSLKKKTLSHAHTQGKCIQFMEVRQEKHACKPEDHISLSSFFFLFKNSLSSFFKFPYYFEKKNGLSSPFGDGSLARLAFLPNSDFLFEDTIKWDMIF